MAQIHTTITITIRKAFVHLLLIDKDGKEEDVEICGLAEYDSSEQKTVDLSFSIEVDGDYWETDTAILYIEDDTGIIAYREVTSCTFACCQSLGGVLGC
jgi:hypothetical protein